MTLAPGEDQHGDLSLTLGEPAAPEEAVTHTAESGKPQGQRISTGGGGVKT